MLCRFKCSSFIIGFGCLIFKQSEIPQSAVVTYCFHFPNMQNVLPDSVGKESACNAGAPGSIPGSGRSPGEGNGNPLQYSCLENPMDRGAWQATVHGVAQVGHDLATKPPLVVE